MIICLKICQLNSGKQLQPECPTIWHQQNVNCSGSPIHISETIWMISPVLRSNRRYSQAHLALGKVVSDFARAFSSAPESICSYGGAFKMLWYDTDRIFNFWCSGDLSKSLRESSWVTETSAQLCGEQLILCRIPTAWLLQFRNCKALHPSYSSLL